MAVPEPYAPAPFNSVEILNVRHVRWAGLVEVESSGELGPSLIDQIECKRRLVVPAGAIDAYCTARSSTPRPART
jgi:hypothetical protein